MCVCACAVSPRVTHVPLMLFVRPTPLRAQSYFADKCFAMTGVEVNLNDPCRGPAVNLPFEVDLVAFELAIVHAFDHIGCVARLVLAPHRPAATGRLRARGGSTE